MKKTLVVTLFALGCTIQAEENYGDIASRVVRILEVEHYSQKVFDDELSSKTLAGYLELLDPQKIYFTSEDTELFTGKFATTIDDSVKQGQIPAAGEIYQIYRQRVRDRLAFAEQVLAEDTITFDSDRSVRINRKAAARAGNLNELKQLWKDLITAEQLRQQLANAKTNREQAAKKIIKRYRDLLSDVENNDTEDTATLFIKAIGRAFDPQTEYYTRAQHNNLKVAMEKRLQGIGAMLSHDEDNIPTVEGLVVGGAAARQGELGIMDKIVGVGQGDGEIVDVTNKTLSDTVNLIRGNNGTTVTLRVRPANAADPSETGVIRITRGQVALKDSLATADLIITGDPAGKDQKLGWIRVPSFYGTPVGDTSSTTDVRRLLTRLRMEKIDGLVLDLRDNNSDALEEARNLTGLFVPRGPVVQVQNRSGERNTKNSRNLKPAYDGPLIVLTNRASASAAEIVAAALQDYRRAVIIGDQSTFGKGTHQEIRPVVPANPGQEANAYLKLTVAALFRINGEPLEAKGVTPDLQLPFIHDILRPAHPLKTEPIPAASFKRCSEVELPIDQLRSSMEKRIAGNRDFADIIEDAAAEKNRLTENRLSLNKTRREAERATARAKAEARKSERIARYDEMRETEKDLFTIHTLTQDNFADARLPLKSELSREAASGMRMGEPGQKAFDEGELDYPHLLDPYERECIRVMQDYISMVTPANQEVAGNTNPGDDSDFIREVGMVPAKNEEGEPIFVDGGFMESGKVTEGGARKPFNPGKRAEGNSPSSIKKATNPDSIRQRRMELKKNSGSETDYLKVGRDMISEGMHKESIAFLEEATALFPENPDFHWLLTFPLGSLEKHQEVISHFEACEKIAKQHRPEILTERFYYQFGAKAERAAEIDLATRCFQRAIELIGKQEPENRDEVFAATVYNHLGYMWLENDKDIDEAGEWIKKASELDPDSAAIADSLGWFHFRKGRFEEAKKELLRAESLLEEPDPVILEHIARTFEALGDKDKAGEYRKKVEELDPPEIED